MSRIPTAARVIIRYLKNMQRVGFLRKVKGWEVGGTGSEKYFGWQYSMKMRPTKY